MGDKEKVLLGPSAGGASVPTAGVEEFSLEPCTGADESAPKRKNAPTAVLDRRAPRRRGEEASEEEPWRAVDSQLTVLEGEEAGDESSSSSDDEELREKMKARYAANIERLFGNNPNVVWVDFPSCCVRPPGVYFPKPRTTRPDAQNDASKEEDDEELGGAVDDVVTPPASG